MQVDRNRMVVLRSRPDGLPRLEDFELVERPLAPPGPGEVLIRNSWLGLAPAARLRMNAEASYAAPMELGGVIHGQTVGEVVASQHAGFKPGDAVLSMHSGWQRYSTSDGKSLYPIDLGLASPQAWLGVLGSSGQTAWIGLTQIGELRAGDTVLVSAAAGAVGALAGQIARLSGARAIGIAGGERKCRIACDEYGYEACIDYRAPDLPGRLAAACPDGVDLYFDNVGGAVRDAAWTTLRTFGRVVVCGLISEYNDRFLPGPNWYSLLTRRLTVRGFIMSDHAQHRPAFVAEMAGWHRAGQVRLREDVTEGLENASAAFIRMLSGGNLGKTLVRLG